MILQTIFMVIGTVAVSGYFVALLLSYPKGDWMDKWIAWLAVSMFVGWASEFHVWVIIAWMITALLAFAYANLPTLFPRFESKS